MKKMAILGALALSLSACVDQQPSPAVQPVADTCGATALKRLVGQDRSVLETMTFAGPLRVIEPGMPVTMDYFADRTNVQLDKTGKIVAVTCG